jgi:hypothetical protein
MTDRKPIQIGADLHAEVAAFAKQTRLRIRDVATDALREWLKSHRPARRKTVKP